MQIKGRRVHIAGSASKDCDIGKLKYAHELIGSLTKGLLEQEASICAQPGKEPKSDIDENVSVIFDWTVIETIHAHMQGMVNPWNSGDVYPLTTVISEKTNQHIPEKRYPIWQNLINNSFVEILKHPRQWTAGAVRRDAIASVGDIVILLSGGEGVEHLAQLYIEQRKPLIALDLDLGASTEEDAGRAVAINRRIASDPEKYLSTQKPELIGALLENISTNNGTRPVNEVIKGILRLLDAVTPPAAFCVRLLNTESPNFQDVDAFFTKIVNPTIEELDYELVVSPQLIGDSRWMNVEIFSAIHHSQLVVADITDERPNCLIELGYALGRNRRLIICAKEGTKLPFDIDKIECFFWSPTDDYAKTTADFRVFVKRNLGQPPLVPAITLF